MKKRDQEQVVYYRSFQDDVVESSNQQFTLPDDYQWVREDRRYKVFSTVLHGLARVFAPIYCRCFLHMKIDNRELLDACSRGFCLYANHTQPIGDAVLPVWVNRSRRIDVIVSPANMGIPVIGKALPYLGALPATGRLQDLRQLNHAIHRKLENGHCLVIYPEAHVWPYYTGIRPFPSVSFVYPVRENTPVYCMTTTYQHRRRGSKPRATVFLDGPFYPETEGTLSERAEKLRQKVYDCMVARSQYSNCQYIRYEKEESA